MLQTDVSNCCRNIIISDDFCFNILSKFWRDDLDILPKKDVVNVYFHLLLSLSSCRGTKYVLRASISLEKGTFSKALTFSGFQGCGEINAQLIMLIYIKWKWDISKILNKFYCAYFLSVILSLHRFSGRVRLRALLILFQVS